MITIRSIMSTHDSVTLECVGDSGRIHAVHSKRQDRPSRQWASDLIDLLGSRLSETSRWRLEREILCTDSIPTNAQQEAA